LPDPVLTGFEHAIAIKRATANEQVPNNNSTEGKLPTLATVARGL
jgi:hypothetical protein